MSGESSGLSGKSSPIVWRKFWIVWRKFWIVWRKFWIVWRKFSIVWRKFWIVWRKFSIVWRKFWIVWRKFWTVWRKFRIVWRKFRISGESSGLFKVKMAQECGIFLSRHWFVLFSIRFCFQMRRTKKKQRVLIYFIQWNTFWLNTDSSDTLYFSCLNILNCTLSSNKLKE